MEIDLELPSNEQEKLDTISDTTGDIMDGEDRIDVDNGDGNSPRIGEYVEECGPSASERVTGSGNQVDLSVVGANVHKGVMCEPQNGLEFESKEAAYSFYREYAHSVGFGITIKASRRSKKSGKFIDVKIACSRFGSKRESSTTTNARSSFPKTGCNAGMHMKRRPDEKWVIYSFVKEHNHEICPDDFYQAIRGRNKQSGIVPCQKKGLQLMLDGEDVQMMLNHFIGMQDENPNFFYAVDLDHEKRLKSVFWVDAKGRHDYRNFSDVVFFDTFYIRNKYKIPFVPITGVNHHFQLILLGCALIGDESTSTFVWLMRTWFKAMGGPTPRVIITDQDKFLTEAAVDVFPSTCHCFCLWHVLSKIPEKLGCVIDCNEKFMAKFNKCIYRSWTDEQFENRWLKIVDKFELGENEWVHSLYKDREKWVPTYLQNTFLAGMSTSERSGSVTSFFDKYMNREATFKEFFEQYKAYLQDRYEMEAEADSETRNKKHGLMSLSTFEKQMSTIYTDTIFKKFQVEVLGVVSCHMRKEREDGSTLIFRVDDFEERQNFYVAWNEAELNICCLCHSFEYRGFLCKHAILVLQMSGFSEIPSRYILKRWTNDAKMIGAVSEISSGFHFRMQRFNDLCKRAIRLGEEGSLSQEAYDIALQALGEALKHCVDMNNSVRGVLEANTSSARGFLGNEKENRGNSMAKASKRKKMHKKKKVRPEPERISIGLQDSCQQMDQMNSRAHTVNNCYLPRRDMQQMDSGSRAPTLDGHYHSQNNMQVVGKVNSISPICDASYYGNQQCMQGQGQLHSISARVSHYGTQQSMHGLGQLGFRASAMHGCFDIQDSLQDMDENSAASTQFHGISSKRLQDKNISR